MFTLLSGILLKNIEIKALNFFPVFFQKTVLCYF